VPPKLIADMLAKDMDLQSPMLVRLFKQEAELEVWKQTRSGQYALLKTYPICRWSGDLGPKVREGDRQAPEGFYSITPGQMNPQSSYYLSFNIGYPNAFDKSLGRTGSQLMVHGDCSSRGCYAMTDEQIAEIYSLGRESFFGGQRAFQVQAFPFKMTPLNMARHRNNPNMPFWKMIKQGYDHFEVTKQEPKVEFCENRYVFDPAQPNASRPMPFSAASKCPVYEVPGEIANAVRDKQRQDEIKTAELIAKGTPVAQRRPDIDGGMHRVFAAKLPDAATGLSEPEPSGVQTAAFTRAPGTIPPTVNPPKVSALAAVEDTSSDAVAAAPSSKVASTPAAGSSDSIFSSLARKVGIGGSSDSTASTAAAKPKAVAGKTETKTEPKSIESVLRAQAGPAKPADGKHVAAARPPLKPTLSGSESSASAEPKAGLVAGAQPIMPPNSFESRFSAVR
jgi:murein L,D-transpeptidase YafK